MYLFFLDRLHLYNKGMRVQSKNVRETLPQSFLPHVVKRPVHRCFRQKC